MSNIPSAAAIRDAASASSLALHGSPMCKPKLKIQTTPGSSDANTFHDVSRKERQIEESITKGRIERNKNELFYSKDELDSSNDLNKQPENINHNLEKKTDKKPWEERPNQKVRSPITANKNQSLNVPVNNTSKPRTPKRKNDDSFREKLKRKKMEDEKKKPFSRLLEGVTLVISGIANPDRGNLRSMAISMGAKYRADWDHSCTHLICAFLNTPKYNQVKGKGKIVKRNWIEECHTQRKRLPWRRFALDNNEQRQVESEDEIIEETVNVAANDENTLNIDEDDPEHVEEASDTEERLLEVTQPSTSKAGTNLDFEDIYSVDTDIEEDIGDSPNSAYTPLKSIFENKKFYVDNSFEEGVLTKLNKYIMAYKGKIILDPSEKPDIIIATEENSQNLKNEYPVFHCVNPNWIWYCHNNQKCMSMEQFLY